MLLHYQCTDIREMCVSQERGSFERNSIRTLEFSHTEPFFFKCHRRVEVEDPNSGSQVDKGTINFIEQTERVSVARCPYKRNLKCVKGRNSRQVGVWEKKKGQRKKNPSTVTLNLPVLKSIQPQAGWDKINPTDLTALQ